MKVMEPTVEKTPPLTGAQWRQLIGLTVAALVVFAVFRWLPTGTNLSHGDFRLEGDNVLEFCDPSAPQFLPVTTARSPVSFDVTPAMATAGQPTTFTLRLATSSGKQIGPVDLMVAHTRKLHVMAVDPTLTDYLHVHPEPTETPGEWTVAFTPHTTGTYRLFADFTPAATARGLYASADIEVDGRSGDDREAKADGFRYELRFEQEILRAREPIDMTLKIWRDDGGAVHLGKVMGAFAHLVAFDRERSGFAHLHPRETDLRMTLDPESPELHFQVTIPKEGEYVIWAQMVFDEIETFVPFWFSVML